MSLVITILCLAVLLTYPFWPDILDYIRDLFNRVDDGDEDKDCLVASFGNYVWPQSSFMILFETCGVVFGYGEFYGEGAEGELEKLSALVSQTVPRHFSCNDAIPGGEMFLRSVLYGGRGSEGTVRYTMELWAE